VDRAAQGEVVAVALMALAQLVALQRQPTPEAGEAAARSMQQAATAALATS